VKRDRIALDVNVPDRLPPVWCHDQQITQVIMNLLTNARDALNEKYAGYDSEKRIQITVSPMELNGGTWLRTTVEDHGNGISADARERLFDPFFTTKGRTVGTGLGLSISHRIVSEHGGRLTAESEPGVYTRFHLDLPVGSNADASVRL